MCSKRWLSTISFLVRLVLVCLFLMTWQAGQAYADSPALDLQIDSPDTIRWDVGNIKPGDSGIEPVTLRNTGDTTGYLLVWIADLVDDEGANPDSETGNTTNPGELSSYIYLDIINDGITFARLTDNGYINIELPITLQSFPGDSDHALYIVNTPIKVGQTLELQWQWALSPDAGNDVQGDTVSFSIYYSLISEKPGGGGGGSKPPPTTTTPSDNQTTVPPTPTPPPPATPEVSDIEVPPPSPTVAARRFVSADGRCVIYIPKGVHVMTGSGKELLNIIIDTPDDTPPAPGPFVFAGPVYRILCDTSDGVSRDTEITPGVQLIMYFDVAAVPENGEISIYSYHPGSGWKRLDGITGPSGGWLTAWVDYLDLVALLVRSEVSGTNAEPTAPSSALTLNTGNVSGVHQVLAEASLGLALSGTIAMMALAYIQRQRRIRQAQKIEEVVNSSASNNTP